MQNIYSIKDKAMGHYQVFMASNDYGAMRYCADLVKQENSFFNAHAEDLELYCLSTLDTDTGVTEKDLRFVSKLEDMKK